jgi:hypothetical protein
VNTAYFQTLKICQNSSRYLAQILHDCRIHPYVHLDLFSDFFLKIVNALFCKSYIKLDLQRGSSQDVHNNFELSIKFYKWAYTYLTNPASLRIYNTNSQLKNSQSNRYIRKLVQRNWATLILEPQVFHDLGTSSLPVTHIYGIFYDLPHFSLSVLSLAIKLT